MKKQTGGHGQYAVVNLRSRPGHAARDSSSRTRSSAARSPRNYIPAVQKGLEECIAAGGVHGFPVVDVTVECYDGKYHAVDSSEMAFKTAAAQGLKEAMAAAGVAVLEPISTVTVDVPASSQGDVMGDVTARRGRVQGTETLPNGLQRIVALVPTAEITRYAIDLRSMTGGRGTFGAVHSHYDVLPAHLLDHVATKP